MVVPSIQESNRIFQISYNEKVLAIRAWLLESHGYQVASALGNAEAKRSLGSRVKQEYRLFMVGHAAPRETREEMVQWLKEHYANTKVFAISPPSERKLQAADFNFVLNGPEEWLAAIDSVAMTASFRFRCLWHWIFVLNIPLAALVLVISLARSRVAQF